MIKIAFVIDTIESPTAGTEKQLLMLIKHLDRSRFEPYLCVLHLSEWLQHSFVDCPVIEIGVKTFAQLSTYVNIVKFSYFLRQKKIDIVQTYFVDGNKIGVLAGRLAGIGTIISTRRNQGYWHNRVQLLILSTLNSWVTTFLANSEDTRQWAVRTETIDPAKIHVIPNSLDTGHYFSGSDEQRMAFRKAYGLPSDAVIVGIVANLRPVKAINVFLRAAGVVAKNDPRVYFVVVGDGPDLGTLKHLAAELGIETRVLFLGNRLDIPEILGCIDIGTLSSNSESFSNAIVEYLAAGLPVICTDVGGAREAVENGINGYVTKPGDHMEMAEKILATLSSTNITAMGSTNRQKAERLFSLPMIMQRYQELYAGVTRK